MNRGMFPHTATPPLPTYLVAGAFKSLVIKVATNTTVTVAADYVTMTDGRTFMTRAVSATIDFAAAGGPNKLDAGTAASATWYSIWAISTVDGTTAALASTSATDPKLPPGYLYKARIGWVTSASGSSNLMGTWQFGRRAQYKLGLAQTTAIPTIQSGVASSTYSATTPTWVTPSVAALVPSTASIIYLAAHVRFNGGTATNVQVAPNNSYTGCEGASPFWDSKAGDGNAGNGAVLSMMLEGTTIAYAGGGTGAAATCLGWEDNI